MATFTWTGPTADPNSKYSNSHDPRNWNDGIEKLAPGQFDDVIFPQLVDS